MTTCRRIEVVVKEPSYSSPPPPPQVMDHLTLIKDVKQSRVTQYVRKTLAKKRLSVEKSSEDVTKTGEGRKSAKSGVQSYKVRCLL